MIGRRVRPGDVILGLASTGVHSNGFSLARDVLMPKGTRAELRRSLMRGGPSVGDAMLTPTRIYVRTVLDLLKRFEISSAAHITGGGIAGNLVRMLPAGVTAWIDLDSWTPPAIFQVIAERGPVEEDEMFRVFNMGIGFILVVRPEIATKVRKRAERLGETCSVIGWVDSAGKADAKPTVELIRRA